MEFVYIQLKKKYSTTDDDNVIVVLKGGEDTIGRYINASYIDVSEVTDVKSSNN